MNEAQTRRDLIDPAIEAAGWTKENGCRILDEQSAVQFAPGKVGRVRGKPLSADYVLTYRGRGRVRQGQDLRGKGLLPRTHRDPRARRASRGRADGEDRADGEGDSVLLQPEPRRAHRRDDQRAAEDQGSDAGLLPARDGGRRVRQEGLRQDLCVHRFRGGAAKGVEPAGDEPENVFVLPLDADRRPICEPFLVSHGTADGASVVGIRLQDHIVISGDRHVSIRESGLVDFGEK